MLADKTALALRQLFRCHWPSAVTWTWIDGHQGLPGTFQGHPPEHFEVPGATVQSISRCCGGVRGLVVCSNAICNMGAEIGVFIHPEGFRGSRRAPNMADIVLLLRTVYRYASIGLHFVVVRRSTPPATCSSRLLISGLERSDIGGQALLVGKLCAAASYRPSLQ